jgi:hypothetical protein
MSLTDLNITQPCFSCLETICNQLKNSTCATTAPISIPTLILYPVLATAIIITVIVSFTCCYLFRRDDFLPCLPESRQGAEETGGRGTKSATTKTQHTRKSQQLDQPTNYADVEEMPTSRFRLKTIRFEPEYHIKTVKSRETTTTGDVAFIAPRDDGRTLSVSKSAEDISKPQTPRSPLSLKPAMKLSPRSPLYEIAGRDRFLAGQKRKKLKEREDKVRDKEKDRERDKDRDREKDKEKEKGRDKDKNKDNHRDRNKDKERDKVKENRKRKREST